MYPWGGITDELAPFLLSHKYKWAEQILIDHSAPPLTCLHIKAQAYRLIATH